MTRDKSGKFTRKADEVREVRTLRLTESSWNELKAIADTYGMTRADLIEGLMHRDFILDPMAMGKLSEEEETKEQEISLDEALVIAKEILTQKKSAKQSIAKLLSVIYKQEVKPETLS